MAGLHVLVTTNGSRLWRWSYRYLGKQRTMAFGSYPETSLAEAREKRDGARKLLQRGVDPADHARTEKFARAAETACTFDIVADDYLDKLKGEGRAETTLVKVRWLLDFARPALGKRPISQISAAEVLVVLKRLNRSLQGSVSQSALG